MNHIEIETKFKVQDFQSVIACLQNKGAHLLHPRLHEMNLRFDTPREVLRRKGQALRLRRSDEIYLTYKGPTSADQGVLKREEIEFTVTDFETTKLFLEKLGFQVVVMYEKYRTAYQFNAAKIFLDDTPIGKYVEIEASTPQEIQGIALELGLKWENQVSKNYLELFEQLRKRLGFSFRDLTFENFSGMAMIEDGVK